MLDANGNSLFNSLVNLNGLNVSGCNLFTGTLDLTNCKYITTVNASGTSLGVLLGADSHVSILNLGSPTSISIVNPLYLNPTGTTVTSYSNLTSIDLKNIPNAKTYSMLEKILDNWSFGAEIYIGYFMGNDGVIYDRT
jgi:hypothetical protein